MIAAATVLRGAGLHGDLTTRDAAMAMQPATGSLGPMLFSVGIIGAGNIAGHHIPGYLQAAEHAQVTAIADVDGERARQRAERLGDVQVFLDYREMVTSPLIDAVDICLPHHLHKDAIVAAAAAGKHILCEKPLCLTLEEADVVARAVAAAGVVCHELPGQCRPSSSCPPWRRPAT